MLDKQNLCKCSMSVHMRVHDLSYVDANCYVEN